MQFRIFQYPLPCDEEPSELNHFLASHKVASVRQFLTAEGETPLLVFVVQVVGKSAGPGSSGKSTRERIDYESILSPEQYQQFNRLRDARKVLADAEGIPVYGVFSNAQLVAMVQKNVSSLQELTAMEGIGEPKAQKYGTAIMQALQSDSK